MSIEDISCSNSCQIGFHGLNTRIFHFNSSQPWKVCKSMSSSYLSVILCENFFVCLHVFLHDMHCVFNLLHKSQAMQSSHCKTGSFVVENFTRPHCIYIHCSMCDVSTYFYQYMFCKWTNFVNLKQTVYVPFTVFPNITIKCLLVSCCFRY